MYWDTELCSVQSQCARVCVWVSVREPECVGVGECPCVGECTCVGECA